MKIGLLGGSFNPPHQGHIHISLEARKSLGLKQIWWIPARQNPLKFNGIELHGKPCTKLWGIGPLGSANARTHPLNRGLMVGNSDKVANCKKITKNHPQLLVKDLQKNMASVYTIDLLKKIIKQYPNQQFYWIMGADNILQLHRWKSWRQIIKLVPIIVCDRDNIFYKAVKSRAFLYAQKLGRVHFLKIKKSAESSTKIREQNAR